MSFLDRWFYKQSSRSNVGTGNLNTGKYYSAPKIVSSREQVEGYVPAVGSQTEPNLRNVPYKYYRDAAITVPASDTQSPTIRTAGAKDMNTEILDAKSDSNMGTKGSTDDSRFGAGIFNSFRRGSDIQERRGSDSSDLIDDVKESIRSVDRDK